MPLHVDHAGVVVAVDSSPHIADAVRWAADEARLHGLKLTLAHVETPVLLDTHDVRLSDRIRRWRHHCARRLLRDTEEYLVSTAAVDPTDLATELRFGSPVTELVDVSKRADLVVVGSRFQGSVGGRRLGSVSASLSYRVECPLAVVHRFDERLAARPVLVGIDGSPASERATAIAFDETSRRRVGLIAVHVWSDVGALALLGKDWHAYADHATGRLGELLACWQERYPDVLVDKRVFCDVPAHHLRLEADRASLVVVGSHGRGAAGAFMLGSVATSVAEGVDVPVIIARGPR